MTFGLLRKKSKIPNRSSSIVNGEHYYKNSNTYVNYFQCALLPLETDAEWRQQNNPFSIIKSYSLPMEI